MKTIIESSAPQGEPTTSETKPPLRSRLPFAVCVLIATLLMFANYAFAVPLALIPGVGRLAEGSIVGRVVLQSVTSLITLATALLLVGLATRFVLRGRLRDVGWLASRDSWWLFGLGWAVSLVAIVVPTVLLPMTGLAHHTPIPPEDLQNVTAGTVVAAVIVQTMAGVALQGIPEELVWRGWLMNCLRNQPRLALLVSAVVFGALHIVSRGGQQNVLDRIVYVLMAMAFAFCAGAMALRLGSLWPAIGVHAGLHLSNMILNLTPLNATGSLIWGAQALILVVIGAVLLAGWKGTEVTYRR
ncbi:CPBP family intramembrane metalloprotease [Naumannella sp. ID2617S]|nr:CPBP family intramembrane metalloprotease [Naumannella sp. ID2617S]